MKFGHTTVIPRVVADVLGGNEFARWRGDVLRVWCARCCRWRHAGRRVRTYGIARLVAITRDDEGNDDWSQRSCSLGTHHPALHIQNGAVENVNGVLAVRRA